MNSSLPSQSIAPVEAAATAHPRQGTTRHARRSRSLANPSPARSIAAGRGGAIAAPPWLSIWVATAHRIAPLYRGQALVFARFLRHPPGKCASAIKLLIVAEDTL